MSNGGFKCRSSFENVITRTSTPLGVTESMSGGRGKCRSSFENDITRISTSLGVTEAMSVRAKSRTITN